MTLRRSEWLRRVPWTVMICALTLIGIGLTGIDRGDTLFRGSFFARQVVWAVLSIPAMIAAMWVPYRNFRGWSYALFALSLLLLVLVFLVPSRHGVHRWIPLGYLNVQPSELAKLAFVLALAHYLMYRKNYRRVMGLLIPFLLTLIPVGLILREPDLGTSLVFLPVLWAMLFAAGARPRHLVLVLVLCAAVSPVLWMAMSAEQKSRIVAVFRQKDSGPAPKGDGYQLHQSKRVLALGGIWGSELTGPALADPLGYHLPESRTDFIFCLVGERWGLAGCMLTLLLYTVLFARGLWIAASTREPFGRLLAVGIIAFLASQTIINAGMTVGLMPITGMTLPLMSCGGSSLLATCVALGLLMNVGMHRGYEISPDPFRFSPGE